MCRDVIVAAVGAPDPPGRRPARRRPHHHRQDRCCKRSRSTIATWCDELEIGTTSARGAPTTLDVRCRPADLRHGDATRLSQALQNLLNNAAKYTAEGGRIELAVRATAEPASTMVTDEGRGIDPQALERIFTLFFQQERVHSREGGLGIGLSLSRALVEDARRPAFGQQCRAGSRQHLHVDLPLLR